MWAWTALLSGLVLFPLYVSSVNAFIPFGVLALAVVLYTLFHPSLRRQADDDESGDLGVFSGDSGSDGTDGARSEGGVLTGTSATGTVDPE